MLFDGGQNVRTYKVFLGAIQRHKGFVIFQFSGGAKVGKFVDEDTIVTFDHHDIARFYITMYDALVPQVLHPSS